MPAPVRRAGTRTRGRPHGAARIVEPVGMSRSFVGAGTLQPNRDIGPGSDSNAKRSKSISPSNISDIWNVSTGTLTNFRTRGAGC